MQPVCLSLETRQIAAKIEAELDALIRSGEHGKIIIDCGNDEVRIRVERSLAPEKLHRPRAGDKRVQGTSAIR